MYAAEWNRSLDVIKALLKSGADPKAKTYGGTSALMFAAERAGDPGVVTALLKAGAEVEARDEKGATPLIYATGRWMSSMNSFVEAILDSSYSTGIAGLFDDPEVAEDSKDTKVNSPSRGPSFNANPEVIKALLKAGANVNQQEKDGKTPLICAARDENPEVITVLLKAGADVNARSPEQGMPDKEVGGVTPLMAAAGFNLDASVVTMLLKSGAEAEARDTTGSTALMYAARSNFNPMVTAVLLKAGANAKTKDKAGKTAFDFAKDNVKLKGTDAYLQLQEASR
jgi:ankyrin repeat protein